MSTSFTPGRAPRGKPPLIITSVSAQERPPLLEAARDRLIGRLWAELPLHGQDAHTLSTVSLVVEAYNDSVRMLKVFREEAVQLVTAVCRAGTIAQLSSAKRADKLRGAEVTEIQRLTALVSLAPIQVSDTLKPELFAKSADDALQILLLDLNTATRAFVDNLLNAFDQLHEHQIVGLVDWPIESACRFRFHEKHLYERDVTDNVDRYDDNETTTYTNTRSGTVDHFRYTSDHHLANAKRHSLPTYEPLIPTRVRDLIDAIPSWLIPEMVIIDGDLFRADVSYQHCHAKEWQETESVTFYHRDPALVLGDSLVLAGWLCEERDSELIERNQQARINSAQRCDQRARAKDLSRRHAVLALWLQAIPLLVHFVAVLIWAPLHLFAVALSVALLFPVTFAIKEYAWARDAVLGYSHYVAGLAATALAVIAIHCLILGALHHSPLLLFAAVVSAVFSWLTSRYMAAALHDPVA